MNIPPPKYNDKVISNPDLFATQAIDATNYLRVVTDNTTIFVEQCTLYDREVSVAPVTTIATTSKPIKIKLSNAVLYNEYQPIIAYQT